nr:hypothetical protein [Angustibacter aerolatus]
MTEVLVLVDHVDGAVRKTTTEPADHRGDHRRALGRVRRRRVRRGPRHPRPLRRCEGLPRRDARRHRLPRRAGRRGTGAGSSSARRRRPCCCRATPRPRRSRPGSRSRPGRA